MDGNFGFAQLGKDSLGILGSSGIENLGIFGSSGAFGRLLEHPVRHNRSKQNKS
jgi:hypothetical protein